LLGGYHAWKELGYPLEEVLAQTDGGASDESMATEDIV
jgi:hypothetical protein